MNSTFIYLLIAIVTYFCAPTANYRGLFLKGLPMQLSRGQRDRNPFFHQGCRATPNSQGVEREAQGLDEAQGSSLSAPWAFLAPLASAGLCRGIIAERTAHMILGLFHSLKILSRL